jgi:hypothetical protein
MRQHEKGFSHRDRSCSSAADRLRLALRCARGGIPVVPLYGTKNGACVCGDEFCRRCGKHPRTKNGIADATTDATEIKRLWAKWPKARIGMVMGAPANLISIETRGAPGRRALRKITGSIPPTVTIRNHDRRLFLFRSDRLPAHSGKIADGVRVLGDGTVIIAPLSLDESTGKRRFAKGRAPGAIEIALIAGRSAVPAMDAKPRSANVAGVEASIATDQRLSDGTVLKFHHGQSNPNAAPSFPPADGEDRPAELTVNDADVATNHAHVDVDARMATIEEILRRRYAMRRLEVCETVAEWVRYAQARWISGQKVQKPPVGRPEGGIARAARELQVPGKTEEAKRKFVMRAIEIDTMSPEAKSAARDAGLDDSPSALLAIARAPAEVQVEKVRHIETSEPVPRRKRAKETEAALAAAAERLQRVKLELEDARSSAAADVQRINAELATATKRVHELEQELEDTRAKDVNIPPFLNRTPFSPEDQRAFDAINEGLANSPPFQAAWASASSVVRHRFVREVLL